MPSRIRPRQQDAWTLYFAAAGADRNAERRRVHGAALAALLLHGMLFALRLPEAPGPRARPELLRPPPRLVDLVLRPRPVEPPPPQAPEPTVAEPALVVPGPPAVDLALTAEPIPWVLDPIAPQIEPLDFLPATPPPPVETAPVRYDSSIDRPLRIYAPLPSYTTVARRIRRQGRVVLEAVIDEHGAVVDAKILKGLGFGLDEAALQTVSTWRFEPARRNGRPIAVIYNLVINFQLR